MSIHERKPHKNSLPSQSLSTRITSHLRHFDSEKRDKSKLQYLLTSRGNTQNKQNMNRKGQFADMKATSILANLPELHSPEVTIELTHALREKLCCLSSGLSQNTEPHSCLPPLKQSNGNYNPKSKNSVSLHRQKIIQLQQWLKEKLKDPPVNLEESMQYRDVIMGIGMERAIKIISKRCREEGQMVNNVWEITWAVCRQIMLYLSKKLRKCEKRLGQEIDFYQQNYSKKIDRLEQENLTLHSENKTVTELRNRISQQLNKTKQKNKNLRLQIISLEDMNNSLKQNFQSVLKQNLLLHLKEEPITEKKKKWVKRSYQSFVVSNSNSPKASIFKNYAQKLLKTQISEDRDDLTYEPSIFQFAYNLNQIKQQERIRISQIEQQLHQRHKTYEKETQTEEKQVIETEINTQKVEKGETQMQTQEKQMCENGINTTISHDYRKVDEKTQKKVPATNKKVKTSKQVQKKEKKPSLTKNKTESQLVVQTVGIRDRDKGLLPKSEKQKSWENQEKQIKQQKWAKQNQNNKNIGFKLPQEQKPVISISYNGSTVNHNKQESSYRKEVMPSIYQKIDQLSSDHEDQQQSEIQQKQQQKRKNDGLKSSVDQQLGNTQQQSTDMVQACPPQLSNCDKKQQRQEQRQGFNEQELMEMLYEKQQQIKQLEYKLRILSKKYSNEMQEIFRNNHFESSRRNSKKILNIFSIKPKAQSKNKINCLRDQFMNEPEQRQYYERKTDASKLTPFASFKFIDQSQSKLVSQKTVMKWEDLNYFEEHCCRFLQQKRQVQSLSSRQVQKNQVLYDHKNKMILQQYKEILKQATSSGNKIFTEKHALNCLQKNLMFIIKDLLKELQFASKNSRVAELKAQYQLLPITIINRFNRMFGVRAVATKHLKDVFIALNTLKRTTKKYDILIYFLMDENFSKYFNIDLFFVYMVLLFMTDSHFSENKPMENEDYAFGEEICLKYLSEDSTFINKLSDIQKYLIENNDSNFGSYFKGVITVYRRFHEERLGSMDIFYRMLAWDSPLNFKKITKFLSVFQNGPAWHCEIINKVTAFVVEQKIYEGTISNINFNKLIMRCPQITIQQLKLGLQIPEEEREAQFLRNQYDDSFLNSLIRFVLNQQIENEQDKVFVENYIRNYIVQDEVMKTLGFLNCGIFDNRISSLLLPQKQEQ